MLKKDKSNGVGERIANQIVYCLLYDSVVQNADDEKFSEFSKMRVISFKEKCGNLMSHFDNYVSNH